MIEATFGQSLTSVSMLATWPPLYVIFLSDVGLENDFEFSMHFFVSVLSEVAPRVPEDVSLEFSISYF